MITKVDQRDLETLTILHISDLHFDRIGDEPRDRYHPKAFPLGKKPVRPYDLHDDLKAVLERVGQQPSCCVVSGDLADSGDKEDRYVAVVDALKGLASFFFHGRLDQFVIIPGNHDTNWGTLKSPATPSAEGYRLGMKEFKGTWTLDECVKLSEPNKYLMDLKLFNLKTFSVLICGLDSNLIDTPETPGLGFVSRQQLHVIKQAIERYAGDPRCVKIAVLHHHILTVTKDVVLQPADKPDAKPIRSVTVDASDFIKWLGNQGFSLVLHGHQHVSYLVSHQNLLGEPNSRIGSTHSACNNMNPIVVAGAGSVSRYDAKAGMGKADNHFQIIKISPSEGIEIVPFRSTAENGPATFEMQQDLIRRVPLYQFGECVSAHMARILGKLLGERKKLEDRGNRFISQLDVSHYFEHDSLSVALREMLIALGILELDNERVFVRQKNKDELPFGFIKTIERFLRERGQNGHAMFGGGAFIKDQHSCWYSPLLILSRLEKTRRDLPGFCPDDIQSNSYALLPIFALSGNKLEILLHKHEGWSAYLIPARPAAKCNFFEVFDFRGGFRADYLQDTDPVHVRCSQSVRDIKPSPSRGILTMHSYEFRFFQLTANGFTHLDLGDGKWAWYSEEECGNLKHVKLPNSALRDYQYGSNGIFHNNQDIIEEAFAVGRKLREEATLSIFVNTADC